MPIKFRCPHCQQFLGISRSKAGSVTDCPTCGRTIRVPGLDGKVAPLPKPKLDYADTGLARALNELANLGAAEVLNGEAAGSPSVPKPEAVALPVPLPPEPMQHVGSPEPEAEFASPARSTAKNPDTLWEPLEELAAMSPGGRRGITPEKRSKSQLLIVGVGCGLLGLVCGLLIARMTGGASKPSNPAAIVPPPEAPPLAAPPPSIPAAEQGAASVDPPPASDRQQAIEGRITYINADGESRPDSGARILALPATREGTSKLAVDSFRTGASDADLRVAQASIRALGGDYVVSGPDGHYTVGLPAAGKFQLIIVSRYQGRGSGGESDPAEIAVLKDWFDKPQLFLGQTQSTLTTVQFDGQTSSTRDHVFPKAE